MSTIAESNSLFEIDAELDGLLDAMSEEDRLKLIALIQQGQ